MIRPGALAIAVAAAGALSLPACDCGSTGADQRRYACTGDEQCATGFACVGGECHRPGDGADAGHLSFATGAQTVAAGACSAQVSVEARSGGGDPWVVAADTTVDLAASPSGGFAFFSDPACAVGAPSATIPQGQSAAGFYFRGTAPGAVTVSATSPALGAAAQVEAVQAVSANPTALGFTTPARTAVAGDCSGALRVELRDGAGNPAPAGGDTAVSLGASPSVGFTFYADASCASPVTAVTVVAGATGASFFFKGSAAGPVTVTAAAAPLSSASQAETVVPGPPASLEISTAPQAVLARACSTPVTLTFRDAFGNAAPVASAITVPLGSAPASGPVFYGGATCATAIAAAPFPAGASSATVFFRGRTGGTFTVTASPSGLAPASQDEVILPTVRRGTCTIAAGFTSAVCAVDPAQLDLSKTFLVFQAVPGSDGAPSSANARCRLTSTSTIACSRFDLSAADVSVSWQTVELPSGIRVQHVDAACGASNVVSVPIAAVSSVANTFVLASHEEFGVNQDDDDMAMVELTSPTNVDLTLTATCTWAISLEVVELSGISVTAGKVRFTAGANAVTVTGLPPAGTGSTAVLHSHDTAIPSSGGLCDRTVRGEVDTGTSLRFRRGSGSTAAECTDQVVDLAYQRIDFGALATVQQVPASMPASTLTADVTIGAVDVTRSLVFSGGQQVAGQAMGETDYAAGDLIGEAAALHQLTSDTNLRLTRGSGNATAQWSSFVIQFE